MINNNPTVVPEGTFLKKFSLDAIMAGGSNVIVPMSVVRQLKHLSSKSSNVHSTLNFIGSMIGGGKLQKGVQYNGYPGKVRVIDCLPLPKRTGDDIIDLCLHQMVNDGEVALANNSDFVLGVRANYHGIPEYKESFLHDVGELDEVQIPQIEKGQAIFHLTKGELFVNQFCMMHDGKESILHRVASNGAPGLEGSTNDKLLAIKRVANIVPVPMCHYSAFGVPARDIYQRAALNLLLDETISLAVILGCAGSGKTFLSLLAALALEKRYSKVLLVRHLHEEGDIGFLSGSKEDKMYPVLSPFRDNLLVIMNKTLNYHSKNDPEKFIKNLFSSGYFEGVPTTTMRGRTINKTLIILDEAHNMTPAELMMVVTRAGEGTKVVVLGDQDQIDRPGLHSGNNGIAHAIDRLAGHNLFGYTYLPRVQRSELAKAAVEHL